MSRTIFPKPILDEPSIANLFQEHSIHPMHIKALYKALFADISVDLNTIPEFPKRIIPHIEENFSRITTSVLKHQVSSDGTQKLLIRLADGHEVETVIIPHFIHATETAERIMKRVTLCVSSQIGCRMACTFCATGTLGLSGNLLAGEILEQLYWAQEKS
jgi:adenine C2-methylase RlmN of 23S rRNA A2503 and tRNA A37